ncbi:hypothetical protein BGAL_0402g00100 [Botrytis galanthina]|uniref:Uncharacterized protein n=1 Tax=Botrytis galanthina TaxID=278940 RepID=A0A4S8QQ36_9HELO|nr:hypothetical protein BGAL_0402g00100 [Botrytis galanthina]
MNEPIKGMICIRWLGWASDDLSILGQDSYTYTYTTLFMNEHTLVRKKEEGKIILILAFHPESIQSNVSIFGRCMNI